MSKTYSDLLADVRSQVRTVSLEELHRRISAREPYLVVDVREKDELRQGSIPGAVHVARVASGEPAALGASAWAKLDAAVRP